MNCLQMRSQAPRFPVQQGTGAERRRAIFVSLNQLLVLVVRAQHIVKPPSSASLHM